MLQGSYFDAIPDVPAIHMIEKNGLFEYYRFAFLAKVDPDDLSDQQDENKHLTWTSDISCSSCSSQVVSAGGDAATEEDTIPAKYHTTSTNST